MLYLCVDHECVTNFHTKNALYLNASYSRCRMRHGLITHQLFYFVTPTTHYSIDWMSLASAFSYECSDYSLTIFYWRTCQTGVRCL